MSLHDELIAKTLMAKPTTDEEWLNIDWDTRRITVPETLTNIGVYNDKDTNRLYFRCPIEYGEFKIADFGIHVNYQNTGVSTTKHDGDVYFVDDVTSDGDYLTFSWLVGRHAYLEQGTTAFIVCCKVVDSDNNIVNELNTTIAILDVLEGLEVDVAPPEDYPDYLEEILRRCEAAESDAADAKSAAETAVTDAAQAKSDAEEAKTAAQTAADDAASAEESASAAQTVADDAKTAADAASSVADEAKTTADEAKTNADEALEIAKEASTTAGEAKTNATDAVNAANEALETAKEAKETADDASTVANGIAGTANEALEKASAAVDTANTASETASEAKETADGIAGTANEALEKATDAWEANKNAITGITVNGEDVPVTDHVAEIEVSGGGYNVSYDDESLVFSGSTLPTYDEPTETLIF